MKKIKAAGVLPYSKDADGRAWFLLGREKPNASWGIDSSSWSEFGGSLNDGETVEEGAAREFFEETMGSVFGHKSWMESELGSGRYLLVMVRGDAYPLRLWDPGVPPGGERERGKGG